MRSRVMPGSSPTMARLSPVMRLKRVDFPTLGRPTITTVGRAADMHPHDTARRATLRRLLLYRDTDHASATLKSRHPDAHSGPRRFRPAVLFTPGRALAVASEL